MSIVTNIAINYLVLLNYEIFECYDENSDNRNYLKNKKNFWVVFLKVQILNRLGLLTLFN